MGHHQEWRDVAHALGQFQMWLLGPVTPTVLPSTLNSTPFCSVTGKTSLVQLSTSHVAPVMDA